MIEARASSFSQKNKKIKKQDNDTQKSGLW